MAVATAASSESELASVGGGTGAAGETGKFKRFFKWVNKKVCARDT